MSTRSRATSSGAADEVEPPRVVVRDKRRVDPESGEVRQVVAGPTVPAATAAAVSAPDDGTGTALAERTADLQRLSAEYANYRKRVERDRMAVLEQAVGGTLASLLPVLDDIDRARQHGDLVGAFRTVADSLEAATAKLGLERYGEPGEPFDPLVHEAVTHAYAGDVTAPTCVAVLSPGYRLAGRVLRPARVSVAEPAEPAGPAEPAEPAEPGPADAASDIPEQDTTDSPGS